MVEICIWTYFLHFKVPFKFIHFLVGLTKRIHCILLFLERVLCVMIPVREQSIQQRHEALKYYYTHSTLIFIFVLYVVITEQWHKRTVNWSFGGKRRFSCLLMELVAWNPPPLVVSVKYFSEKWKDWNIVESFIYRLIFEPSSVVNLLYAGKLSSKISELIPAVGFIYALCL